MNVGITYYPEYYRPDRWPEHLGRLREAGLRRLRMGEFAWSLIQPAKEQWNWDILDRAIAAAGDYGIEVVLGTPTACPPIWLVEEHPEILPVDIEGRRASFGARQHRCFNAPAYVEASRRIVTALAQRYGSHPNVVAWQIDNELGGEQKHCYCDVCRVAFQECLRTKYGRIEALNERWMNHFWSQDYQDWSQIPIPRRHAGGLPMRHHPSLELEFCRFCSHSIAEFCAMQADILRRYTRRPVTHNTDTFCFGDQPNVFELFQSVDVAGMDVYGDKPHEIAFYADLTRSLKDKPFWMMEYGTRSANLGAELDLVCRRDCEWFMLFKLLPFPWGQEQDRKALLTITGQPEPNYHVVRQWIQDHAATTAEPFATPEVGLYYHFDSSWVHWIDQWRPHLSSPERQVYPRYVIDRVYRALFDAGIPVQIVFTPEAIRRHKIVIVPRQIVYEPALEEALIAFVRGGGQLIVTTDLFLKNADNVYLESVPRIYAELLDWHEPVFMNGPEPGATPVIKTCRRGVGQTWLVQAEGSLDAWRAVVEQLLAGHL